MTTLPSAREIARNLYNNGVPCNCDLDKWEPEQTTGHSRVCRIHRTATNAARSAQENHTGQGEDA